jgi:hypothetical protein
VYDEFFICVIVQAPLISSFLSPKYYCRIIV